MTTNRLTPESLPDLGALTIRSVRNGDTEVVELAGELDVGTAAAVKQELALAQRNDPLVVAIDLRELTFIDPIGIGLIVDAEQRSSQGGYRVIVVRGTPAVQRVFALCDVADQLTFVDALGSDVAGSRSTATPDDRAASARNALHSRAAGRGATPAPRRDGVTARWAQRDVPREVTASAKRGAGRHT